MSDYSDLWNDLNSEKIEKEKQAQIFRKRLQLELSFEDMIKIIFARILEEIDNENVIKLGDMYLKS